MGCRCADSVRPPTQTAMVGCAAMRIWPGSVRRRVILDVVRAVLVAVVTSACGGASSAGTEPSVVVVQPVVTDPTGTPPAGLDTSERRLLDGAGRSSPLRARLLWVDPGPGSRVLTSPMPPLGDIVP